METANYNWRRLVVPVAFAFVCLVLTILTFNRFGGSLPLAPAGYRVEIPVRDATGVVEGSDVQVSGVDVGQVVGVGREGAKAVATLEIDSWYAPVRSDAKAIVRQKTPVGEGYIELTPGSADAPAVADGGRIRTQNVRRQVPLDAFLETFDEATRQRLRSSFADLSRAFDGRGEDLNTAFGRLGSFAPRYNSVLEVVDGERASLRQLFRQSGAMLESAGRNSSALEALVLYGREVFGETARRDRELRATMDALPPFLAQLRRTSNVLTSSSDELHTAMLSLEPSVPLFAPALRAAAAANPQLTRVFRRLPRLQAASRSGLPALNRILAATKPAFGGVYPAARELIPFMMLLGEYRTPALIGTLANIGQITNAKMIGPDGKVIPATGGATTIWNESVAGWKKKLPSSRYNPYPIADAPVKQLAKLGFFESYDCRHTGNTLYLPPTGSGAPPCLTQGPWTFRGKTAFYPRLELDPP